MAEGDQQQALKYFNQAAESGSKDLAQQAQSRLAQLEMEAQPDKYIASQAYVGKDGYLYIAVRNNSSLGAENVQLELVQLDANGNAMGRDRLDQAMVLEGGQRVDLKTGIGPFQNTAAASQFRSQVISARPQNAEQANKAADR